MDSIYFFLLEIIDIDNDLRLFFSFFLLEVLLDNFSDNMIEGR